MNPFLRDETRRAVEELIVPGIRDSGEGWPLALAAQHCWANHLSKALAGRVPTVLLDEERSAQSPEELAQLRWNRTTEQRARAEAGGAMATLRVSVPLDVGQPFFFSDRICGLLDISAQSVPPAICLVKETIPAEHGFWYFERPLPIKTGSLGPLRALTWAGVSRHEGVDFYNLGPHWYSLDGVEALDLVFWLQLANGMILPATHIRWLIGEAYEVAAGRSPLKEDPAVRIEKLRILVAALTFIHQRVLVTAPMIADRASRRRLALAPDKIAAVQVVTLRKFRPLDQPENREGKEVSWSCRWGVSGHWRNQAVGRKRSSRRLTWVHGHVKGPNDKPLRHVERVFAVQR